MAAAGIQPLQGQGWGEQEGITAACPATHKSSNWSERIIHPKENQPPETCSQTARLHSLQRFNTKKQTVLQRLTFSGRTKTQFAE